MCNTVCDLCAQGRCEGPEYTVNGQCQIYDRRDYHCILPDSGCPEGLSCWWFNNVNFYTHTLAECGSFVAETCMQQDIDYPGEDINGEPIKVSTWQECAAECRKEPQCSVFTFNDHHEHCWLKTSAAWANRKEHSQGISGGRNCDSPCEPCGYGKCEGPEYREQGDCEIYDGTDLHCILPNDHCPPGLSCWKFNGVNFYTQKLQGC